MSESKINKKMSATVEEASISFLKSFIKEVEKLPKVDIGCKVRSIYGCCGKVVAICHPEESVIIQMDDGRANRCHLWNFWQFYKIASQEQFRGEDKK